MPETMAEVCWWRLMAEEVRTQAEDFSSASAKTTMLDVAATWDRMADNLERHLTDSPSGREGMRTRPSALAKPSPV
jgi:hypothetical protein